MQYYIVIGIVYKNIGNAGIMDTQCQNKMEYIASSLEEANTICSGDVNCGGFSDVNGTGVSFHLCEKSINPKHLPGTVLYTKGKYTLFNDSSSHLHKNIFRVPLLFSQYT